MVSDRRDGHRYGDAFASASSSVRHIEPRNA